MNLTFINDTKTPNEDIWLTYYGLDPLTGFPSHMADCLGGIVPNVPSEAPTGSLSIPISLSSSFVFPMLNAGRLYISFGNPLLLAVDGSGNPIPPQSADPKDPNYKTPWDFFEVTYIPTEEKIPLLSRVGIAPIPPQSGLFNFNLSNVQSAGLPLTFQVTGYDPSTKKPVDYNRGWLPGGFRKFHQAIRKNPDFAGLLSPGYWRVLAPGTAITAFNQKVIPNPVFDSEYLKAYIESVWKKFETETLTFVGDPPPGSNSFVTWTGKVFNGQFTFKTKDLKLEPIVLNVPTTSDLFENNFLFCASGRGAPRSLQENYALQLFGTLCAAFNRSVMLTTTKLANSSDCEWCKASSVFYQDPTTNHYSKEIHANMIDGLAYAFQSDDHCDVSSFVSVLNPLHLTITLVGE